MAAPTSAQEEFAELMREKSHRTNHPSDDSTTSVSDFSDLDSSEAEERARQHHDSSAVPFPDAVPRPSFSSSARDTIPRTRYAANTGPKGVIADAQNFRDSRRAHRASVQRLRGGSNLAVQNLPFEKRGEERRRGDGRGGKEGVDDEVEEEGEEDEDEDEDDDGFMREWRQSRLQELQHGRRSLAISPSRRTKWSGMLTVDANGYLDAVEKSGPQTTVLVYIYDDSSDVSDAIESALRGLAPTHPGVRFVRLHFLRAEIERAGVPAILAYRGGEMFASLVPLVDELPDDAELGEEALEAVLMRHQMLHR